MANMLCCCRSYLIPLRLSYPLATTTENEEIVTAQPSKGKNKSTSSKKKEMTFAAPTMRKMGAATSNVKISRLGVSDTCLNG